MQPHLQGLLLQGTPIAGEGRCEQGGKEDVKEHTHKTAVFMFSLSFPKYSFPNQRNFWCHWRLSLGLCFPWSPWGIWQLHMTASHLSLSSFTSASSSPPIPPLFVSMLVPALLVLLQPIKLIPNEKPLYLWFLCLECLSPRPLKNCLIIQVQLKCYRLLWPPFKSGNLPNHSGPLCPLTLPLFFSWHLSLSKVVLFLCLLDYCLFLLLQWKLQERRLFVLFTQCLEQCMEQSRAWVIPRRRRGKERKKGRKGRKEGKKGRNGRRGKEGGK